MTQCNMGEFYYRFVARNLHFLINTERPTVQKESGTTWNMLWSRAPPKKKNRKKFCKSFLEDP